MPALKTETLTFRLNPDTKAELRQLAEQERRSLSNMLEIMIRDYFHRRLDSPHEQQGRLHHGSAD